MPDKLSKTIPKKREPKSPPRHVKHPGILRAQETATITLQSDLIAGEQVVVVTPKPGQVTLLSAEQRECVLRNDTDTVVPYVLAVVPARLVQLAKVDWAHLARETRRGLEAIPFFQRLLGRKSPKGE